MADSDKARIEELEREVSQLRSQIEAPARASTPREPLESEALEGELGDDELAPPTNWSKIIVTSAVIVCIALGLMFAIFQALSAGIESMAPKAAGMFVPEADERKPAPAPKKSNPGKLRVPGL